MLRGQSSMKERQSCLRLRLLCRLWARCAESLIPADADEAFVVDAAKNDERIGAWLEGKQILR